jgi:hypothetical protein
MQEWTLLVQQVDRLILELKRTQAEARRWRTRALELENHQGHADREILLETQAKERELEKLKKERVKTMATLEKILADLDKVQSQVMEMEESA